MANSDIKVEGNITRDLELRFTADGTPVCNFAIADTQRRKEGDQWVDGDTTFYNVAVWRRQGENVAKSLKKGDRVIVLGAPRVREFERNDGTKGQSFEIDADTVAPSLRFATATVIPNGSNGNSGNGQSAPQAQSAPQQSAPAATNTDEEEPF